MGIITTNPLSVAPTGHIKAILKTVLVPKPIRLTRPIRDTPIYRKDTPAARGSFVIQSFPSGYIRT